MSGGGGPFDERPPDHARLLHLAANDSVMAAGSATLADLPLPLARLAPKPMDAQLLLVEDDASVRESTALLLERAGFRVTAVADGGEALELLSRRRFDLVVLDILHPGVDGLEVCRELRRYSQMPVVMLTAKADTSDVVAGLELGADDYVTKPFEGPELIARVRAVVRRAMTEDQSPVLNIRGLEIDPAAFSVHRDGVPIELTATEFRLLLELARNRGQVLTREVLLERVWGYDYLGDSRLVDMALKRLRDKIGDDPKNPLFITTVRGVGYRFERD
ncbi:MAG: response regulator [Acidimicrobiia bacterium]